MIKKSAYEYKIGRRCTKVRLSVASRLAVGIGVLVIGWATLASGGEAQPGETAVTCANISSGTSWQIRIDYGKSTVDSNPARISDGQISWRDASDGGNYTLDRKSGNLTAIVASSTGGAFFYHHCKLAN
jgi:hypothetical protein